MRVLSSALLLLLLAAPAASADGFREREVRKVLDAAGYRAIAAKVATAARPVLTVDRTLLRREPRALGTTRLGGRPDLPVAMRWPRCRGYDQTFLAQIAVGDLPAAAGELRRHGGTLSFFTYIDHEDFGYDQPWTGACSTVLHTPPGTALRRASHPKYALGLLPARPRFATHPDIPGFRLDTDFLMAPLRDVAPVPWKGWYEARGAVNGKPKQEHRLLGYSYAPNGGNACSARAERAKDTWRHLFTFGWDEEIGFSVGDGGTIQLLISPKDLRTGRFDRVCGVFDSA